MIDYDRILRNNEKAVYRLRELFGSYGYRRFKTGKFEEYELYTENKDFLGDDGILTFTDARGKLMALKPDVTLGNHPDRHRVHRGHRVLRCVRSDSFGGAKPGADR